MATLADLFEPYKAVSATQQPVADDANEYNPIPTITPNEEWGNFMGNSERASGVVEDVFSRIARQNDELSQIRELNDLDEFARQEGQTTPEQQPTAPRWWMASGYSVEPSDNTRLSGFTPTGSVTKYNRGNLQSEIEQLFKRNGINIRVTSGKRSASQRIGNSHKTSHHNSGNACDIVPTQGETFDSIRRKMLDSPEILQFFHSNGLGVIDETNSSTMRKTGATGKHYHIGPDNMAVTQWSNWLGKRGTSTDTVSGGSEKQRQWTRNLHSTFVKALKKKYPNYNDRDYNRIASYMTQQAALESGYGEKANGFNYAGHMSGNKPTYYGSMDEFVNAHLRTLDKWDFMKAKSLDDYVNSLYKGQYHYSELAPSDYLARIRGTTSRVNGYLGQSARFGGKFTELRQMHEEGFRSGWS